MKAKPYRAVVSMCFNVETADKARAEKDIEHVLDRSLKAFAMNGYHSTVKLESIERLLPCPFCGGAAAVGEVIPGWYKVCCKNDNCVGCNTGKNYQLKEEAIEAWNRRADTCKTET